MNDKLLERDEEDAIIISFLGKPYWVSEEVHLKIDKINLSQKQRNEIIKDYLIFKGRI